MSPAIYTLFAHWIPPNERSTALSLITIGGNVGAVITMPLAGFLCVHGYVGIDWADGWPLVFYVLGFCGLFCALLWHLNVYDCPHQHPRIQVDELKFIQSNVDVFQPPQVTQALATISSEMTVQDPSTKVISSSKKLAHAGIPWRRMLMSGQLWVVATAKFCVCWGNMMLMSKLPSYLEKMLHMHLAENANINAIVYVSICVAAFVFGRLSDILLKKQILSKLTSRKLFESVALFGSGTFLMLVPLVGCNQEAVIGLLIASSVCYACIVGGDTPIVLDLAPDYSGSLYGLTNSFASLPGFVTPFFVGLLLDQEVRKLAANNLMTKQSN